MLNSHVDFAHANSIQCFFWTGVGDSSSSLGQPVVEVASTDVTTAPTAESSEAADLDSILEGELGRYLLSSEEQKKR